MSNMAEKCYDTSGDTAEADATHAGSRWGGHRSLGTLPAHTDAITATLSGWPLPRKYISCFELPLLGSNQDSSDPESGDAAFIVIAANCYC
jgi:hypothetical protein